MAGDDLRRIRFVTERFRDLQGLRWIPGFAVACCFIWITPYARLLPFAGPAGVFSGLLLICLPAVIAFASRHILDEYYANKFGIVTAAEARRWQEVVQDVLLIAAVIVDVVWLRAGRPSAILIFWGLVALHIVIRDWPWRMHHVLGACTGFAGAAVVAASAPWQPDELLEVMRAPFTAAVAARAVTGYLDHRLLVRALRRNQHGESAAAEAELANLRGR